MLFYKKNVEIFSHTPTFIIEPLKIVTRTGICRFHIVEPRQGSATQALLARTNGFAFTHNGVAYSKKDKQQCLSFLLVTRTGLEPMLPP